MAAAEETTFYETSLDGSLLTAGTNVLAVEVHQNAPTSSDLSFNAKLHGLGVLNAGRVVYLTAPADGAELEIGASTIIEAKASAGYGRRVAKVEFFDGSVKIGEVETAPYLWAWTNAVPGLHTLTAVATDNSDNTITSLPTYVTLSFPKIVMQLIPAGAIWKYDDTGADLGTAWTNPDFNDALWASGRARLGYGGDGEITLVNSGPLSAKFITTYFRHDFQVNDLAAATNLTLRLQRDDGALIYLNGVEVFRSNMPLGPISAGTAALVTVGGPEERLFFEAPIPAEEIRVGRNVLAVEVHQVNATSSDLGFDLELIARAPVDQIVPTLDWQWLERTLRFSWLAAAPGWELYARSEMVESNAWVLVPGPTLVTNGSKVIYVIPDDVNRFFRLIRR